MGARPQAARMLTKNTISNTDRKRPVLSFDYGIFLRRRQSAIGFIHKTFKKFFPSIPTAAEKNAIKAKIEKRDLPLLYFPF